MNDHVGRATSYREVVDADGLTYEAYLSHARSAPAARVLPLVASTGRMPAIDSKGSCRQAQKFSAEEHKEADFTNCLEDEASAREQLASVWPTFKLADRQSCVELTRFPTPRYVELLTCVEMNTGQISTGGIAARSGRNRMASEATNASRP